MTSWRQLGLVCHLILRPLVMRKGERSPTDRTGKGPVQQLLFCFRPLRIEARHLQGCRRLPPAPDSQSRPQLAQSPGLLQRRSKDWVPLRRPADSAVVDASVASGSAAGESPRHPLGDDGLKPLIEPRRLPARFSLWYPRLFVEVFASLFCINRCRARGCGMLRNRFINAPLPGRGARFTILRAGRNRRFSRFFSRYHGTSPDERMRISSRVFIRIHMYSLHRQGAGARILKINLPRPTGEKEPPKGGTPAPAAAAFPLPSRFSARRPSRGGRR